MADFPVAALPWFEAWKEKNGEHEPDFATLSSIPDLPELLRFYDERPVRTQQEWNERKAEIRQLLSHYIIGSFPATIPALVSSEVQHQQITEGGGSLRKIKLTFETANCASILIEVMIPPGAGPFPVFVTQGYHRDWGLLAFSRGYMVCIYPGSDNDDQSDVFKEAYPDCDWCQTGRRAWVGSRSLDYILSLRETDPAKIAIAGHSRYGKQSLIAAAFDERFSAVVASSSGSGGACPFRFVSESAFQESAEFITRSFPDWYHPRLRFFAGREEKLPIDCHGLLGLIAPRPCLVSTALNDPCESAFAVERSCQASLEAYRFVGAPDDLRLHWRYSGGHDIYADNVQTYLDWLDNAFSVDKSGGIAQQWMHRFDWNEWKARQREERLTPPDHAAKRERILWALGEIPHEPGAVAANFGRTISSQAAEPVKIKPVTFGEGVRGDLYFREDRSTPSPVVIWLHPFSYPTGYKGAYVSGPRICGLLAEQGYTVLAFDQLGFGGRLTEGEAFYRRYPEWSRLGKMVRDVRSAVDLLQATEQMPDTLAAHIDLNSIYCLGYSIGGMVALYAGALDQRIAGVASFSGFTPMRSDTDAKYTGGIRRLWEWYGLVPRLGLFHNEEGRIPYDYDDILSLIAPRPCLVVSPRHDREADAGEIAVCIASAKAAWTAHGADDRLDHLSPEDYNRFHTDQHHIFIKWLENLGARPH